MNPRSVKKSDAGVHVMTRLQVGIVCLVFGLFAGGIAGCLIAMMLPRLLVPTTGSGATPDRTKSEQEQEQLKKTLMEVEDQRNRHELERENANRMIEYENERQRRRFVARGFQQRAARDGSAVDGGQVGVVGLVAGIDRLTVLLGDEGMKDAGLETGGGKGALHDPVVAAGAFDGSQAVTELVLLEGLSDLSDGSVEGGARMNDHRGRDEQRP